MATFVLIIIYIAFISLGLPDGMLGAAWPTMRLGFGMPVGHAGFVSFIISGGTIVSSLLSVKVIRKFGTGKVTAFSVLLTALGLTGFALTPSFWWLFLEVSWNRSGAECTVFPWMLSRRAAQKK